MNETLSYLKKRKKTFVLLTAILFFGIILGILSYPNFKEQTRQMVEVLKNLVINENKLLTALNIFLKNIEASFIALLLGPTVILPLMIVFSNGFVAGLVMNMAGESGKPGWKIVLSLLPHGILEMLAFFLSISKGMDIAIAFIKPEGKTRIKAVKEAIKDAVKTYIKIVIPLLVLAALIETYISTQVII